MLAHVLHLEVPACVSFLSFIVHCQTVYLCFVDPILLETVEAIDSLSSNIYSSLAYASSTSLIRQICRSFLLPLGYFSTACPDILHSPHIIWRQKPRNMTQLSTLPAFNLLPRCCFLQRSQNCEPSYCIPKRLLNSDASNRCFPHHVSTGLIHLGNG